MVIGLLRVDLMLPDCNSLKEKRSVLKRQIFRIRKNYNAAVAETASQDLWRRAELSFVTVNSDIAVAEKTLRNILADLDSHPVLEVLADQMEML